MKLIYLSNARIPTEKAHGLQIMKMCENFSLTGCEVELLLPKRANDIAEDPFEFYGTPKIFKLSYLSCVDQNSITFLPEKISFIIQTATFYLSARWHLLRNQYDVIYSRETAVALCFVRVVIELHSLPAKISFINSVAWRRAEKLTVLTSFIKQSLVECGIASDKILVAPDAADLEAFAKIMASKKSLRRAFNLSEDIKIFSYIGKFKTMGMDKGVGLFIKAFARICANRTDCLLLLVGLNPDEIGEIEILCQELELTKNKYRLVLHVPQQEAFKYMKASDMLVMAYPNITHYAYYMSPLKLFEYMASGTAILSTDLPSIREVLNENNAILVGSDSEEEFVRGIESALADSSHLVDLAAQAYKDVSHNTWQNRAKRILDFISGRKIL